MATAPLAAEDLREPPPPHSRVYLVCGIGLALLFVAFLAGLVGGAPRRGYEPHSLDVVRMLLCVVGMVLIGSGVSLRPAFFGGWVFFALGGIFGYGFGAPPPQGTEWQLAPPRDWLAAVPNAWDSLQLLYGFLALFGVGAVIITNLSRRVVFTLLLLGIAYHWSTIYSAVTSPPPSPWLTGIYWQRMSRPYLQPIYLANAYQFYSPDPGPANEIWACLEYVDQGVDLNDLDAVKQSKEVRWIYLPKREREGVDPLGLYYFRHLAVTENIAQYSNAVVGEEERELVRNRRNKYISSKGMPVARHPAYDESVQYRLPSELVIRQILPSFVRHLVATYPQPGKKVFSVKVYRVLHNMLQLPQIREQPDVKTGRMVRSKAFDPITYLPYFQGDYDAEGVLKDPNDGMLYWLLPIIPKKPLPPDRTLTPENFAEYFTDYVSEHAGNNRFEVKAKVKE